MIPQIPYPTPLTPGTARPSEPSPEPSPWDPKPIPRRIHVPLARPASVQTPRTASASSVASVASASSATLVASTAAASSSATAAASPSTSAASSTAPPAKLSFAPPRPYHRVAYIPDSPRPPGQGRGPRGAPSRKGTGLLADRAIPQATIIVAEPPFFKFRDPITRNEMKRAYAGFTDAGKILFLSFGARTRTGDERAIMESIAETNSIPMLRRVEADADDPPAGHAPAGGAEPDDDDVVPLDHQFRPLPRRQLRPVSLDPDIAVCAQDTRGESGMFANVSYANHSCAPNAGWYWHAESEELHIAAGDEITASYLDADELLHSTPARGALLEERFGFACCCAACARPAPALARADANLAACRAAFRAWFPSADEGIHIAAYAARPGAQAEIERAIRLLRHERRWACLPEAYSVLCQFHLAHGPSGEHDAGRAAAAGLQMLRATMGPAADGQELALWARQPHAYGYYGVLAAAGPVVPAEARQRGQPWDSDDSDNEDGEWGEVARPRARGPKRRRRVVLRLEDDDE